MGVLLIEQEFFLYTDGEEEKDTVLEGLGLILA